MGVALERGTVMVVIMMTPVEAGEDERRVTEMVRLVPTVMKQNTQN